MKELFLHIQSDSVGYYIKEQLLVLMHLDVNDVNFQLLDEICNRSFAYVEIDDEMKVTTLLIISKQKLRLNHVLVIEALNSSTENETAEKNILNYALENMYDNTASKLISFIEDERIQKNVLSCMDFSMYTDAYVMTLSP
jgi:hypothetical protein